MRKYIVAFIALLAVVILLGVWLYRPVEKQPLLPQISHDDKPTAMASATPRPAAVRKQMPGGPYEPSDPRWAEVHAKDQIDKGWEWKMPINFSARSSIRTISPSLALALDLAGPINLGMEVHKARQAATDRETLRSKIKRVECFWSRLRCRATTRPNSRIKTRSIMQGFGKRHIINLTLETLSSSGCAKRALRKTCWPEERK